MFKRVVVALTLTFALVGVLSVLFSQVAVVEAGRRDCSGRSCHASDHDRGGDRDDHRDDRGRGGDHDRDRDDDGSRGRDHDRGRGRNHDNDNDNDGGDNTDGDNTDGGNEDGDDGGDTGNDGNDDTPPTCPEDYYYNPETGACSSGVMDVGPGISSDDGLPV